MFGHLQLHPLCTLFPRIDGVEFEALKVDIQANGLREPIVIHDGMILDGGNRYRACLEAGVDPMTVQFDGCDPLAFVLSRNLHRRHLTPGQQAAIVAAATDWLEAQTHGGDRKSDQAATLPLDTVADRAAQSGASDRTQRMADKVAKADPELAKRVARGEISLPKAVRQVEGKVSNVGDQIASPHEHTDEESSVEGDFGPSPEEIAEAEEIERASREKYDKLVEVAHADDKMGELMKLVNDQSKEIGRLRAEIAVLRERQTGLLNEKVALESAAKRWRRIAEQHGYSDKGAK
ncbi:ParB N-terminal domain-containing protein [Burkholderia sp. Bp8984]|uniref:ParB N-terminal domain-containing protein n=1 Tax=Burkholderia sp. Bp8984 TaxID=2184549 RepID=UPI000F59E5E3|nr:ParB N-terminal domain-containing protein [Burkholderia sp. Bp8984]RQS63853.1 S-adenosylmethionine-binding protein [Burkholderia sp. Bp8984]